MPWPIFGEPNVQGEDVWGVRLFAAAEGIFLIRKSRRCGDENSVEINGSVLSPQ
jgi:hypothetical protein